MLILADGQQKDFRKGGKFERLRNLNEKKNT